MSIIINTLNHVMTPEQVASLPVEGEIVHVRDWAPELAPMFTNSPSDADAIRAGVRAVIGSIESKGVVGIILPGGSPAWMFALARLIGQREGAAVCMNYPRYLFAHSERVSVEEPQPDGSVRKTAVFQHRGWIVL